MSMNYALPQHLNQHQGSLRALLEPMLTADRVARFSAVLDGRTRAVAPVFQDTHHCHNISAVLRTADALGFQDAFFVYQQEYRKPRLHDTVERGASRWLSLRRASTIAECAHSLQNAGYAIALVTLPSFWDSAVHYQHHLPAFSCADLSGDTFFEFLGNRKLALVFGNEADGIDPEWTPHAHLYCYVKMTGFVESLNLSVCAGMLLGKLREVIDSRLLPSFSDGLLPHERDLLLDHWCLHSTPKAKALIEANAPELKEYYRNIAAGCYFKPFSQ
jgi:tRNA (guanosine-2'-O-)-methyltransferase